MSLDIKVVIVFPKTRAFPAVQIGVVVISKITASVAGRSNGG
jgi:hypothetical protein